jgi:hypothetical protein
MISSFKLLKVIFVALIIFMSFSSNAQSFPTGGYLAGTHGKVSSWQLAVKMEHE